MIGPEAYENMFQWKQDERREYHVEYGGRRYIYTYDWETLAMFEGATMFKEWCIEDAMTLGGKYAVSIEVVQ
tara:strand:+ start:130 stop:345 length:216 start_codon:yes stop_codon:yes gene_type:complete